MDEQGGCGQSEGHHGAHRDQANGGCCGQGHEAGATGARAMRRRFISKEERIAWLQTYLGQLRAEVTAVEEHLAEMQATS